MTNLSLLPEDIRSEFTVNEQGQAFASRRAIARLAGVDHKNIVRLLQNLGDEKSPEALKSFKNWENKELVPYEIAEAILKYYGFEALSRYISPLAATNYWRLQNIEPPEIKKERKNTNSEKRVRDKLWRQEGGEREVITPAGNIDLLTSTEIIEVKSIKGWKSAIGQILVYGKYYPSHQKRIHLFGKCHEAFLNLIVNHCKEFNIMITWES